MSDDEDKKNGNGKRRSDREISEVLPVPKDREFAEWLERLFYDEPELANYPEKIEVVILKGARQRGPLIVQKLYAPDSMSDEVRKKSTYQSRKPTKEQVVALSNELLHRMQRDCDESRKATTYAVFVWHYKRGDEPYDHWIKRFEPKGNYSKDGENGVEDEELTTEKKFVIQVLHQQREMISMLQSANEGIMDRQDRINQRLLDQSEHQQARIAMMWDMMERALSGQVERDIKLGWAKMAQDTAARGLDLVAQIAPPLVNQLVGKKIVPTIDTIESITLKNFLRLEKEGGKLTNEQSNIAFGEWAEDGTLIRPGILSFEQAKILVEVAHGGSPPEKLDELLPPSPLMITMTQIQALGQVFSMEQLAPIQILFEGRLKRKKDQVKITEEKSNGEPKK